MAATQWGIVAMMVTTRTRQPQKGRLYLREHRKAHHVSPVDMAQRLGIERESLYRQEREWWRANAVDWADALGVPVKSLYGLPGAVSLDDILEGASDNLKKLAADIVQRMVDDEKNR